MKRDPTRLGVSLCGIQLTMHATTFLLVALFTPRVLLLEPAAANASVIVIATIGGLTAIGSTVMTILVLRRLDHALRSIALGGFIAPPSVHALYALPARLATSSVGFAVAASFAMLVPGVTPQSIDTYTGLTLVLFVLTMASTAALPAYVAMRAAIARILEVTPPESTQEALRRLGRRALFRVRKRFVAAVAAPVAFVALGASLLVDAHARTLDREARVRAATDMARAAFEPLRGPNGEPDVRGRAEAIEAAALFGYRVRLDASIEGQAGTEHHADGETQVTVPLEPGAVQVRFEATRLSSLASVYALLAFLAVAIAGILGTRTGAAFEADVALATREVRRAGVAEVMRGTIIQHQARFAVVHALLEAIDGLGGIFRQFAGAQQRAIEAREATERMRGLLLASMSHDLKAPLNAVLGFAELVGRNQLTDAQRESLAIIEQRGRELLILIDTILDSARVEAGELEVAPESTHVGDVVMSSVLEARDLAVGTEVQIKGEIQPGVPTLLVDGTRIAQALTGVVMTAVRFSHKGIVSVTATLPDPGNRLRIEVETSGEGLPLVEREKIFSAFKSAESARRQGALGLGLQLARSIVEIHAGSIEVDGTPGGGMIFRIWLPTENDRASIRARASKPTLPPS